MELREYLHACRRWSLPLGYYNTLGFALQISAQEIKQQAVVWPHHLSRRTVRSRAVRRNLFCTRLFRQREPADISHFLDVTTATVVTLRCNGSQSTLGMTIIQALAHAGSQTAGDFQIDKSLVPRLWHPSPLWFLLPFGNARGSLACVWRGVLNPVQPRLSESTHKRPVRPACGTCQTASPSVSTSHHIL